MKEKKAKKILSGVNKTYSKIAEEFSNTRYNTGKEFSLFTKYLKKGSTIIDLGCGNGRLVPYLEKEIKKYKYIGIDNNKELLEISKQRYPKHKFIIGDQISIPLGDNLADAILVIRAFHHIPSKKLRKQSLDEIKRVLKKDGTVIITVWNIWQKKYIKQILFGIFRCIITLGRYSYNDLFIPWGKMEKRYYHAFTKRELSKLMVTNGFETLEFHNKYHDYIIIAKKNDK